MNRFLYPSRVLKKLRGGGVASCVKLNLGDPAVVEIAGLAGLDSVWIDMEHVPSSWRDVRGGIRAARVVGMDVVVRVPRGSYSDLVKPLEAGATAIMVPHVMGADDAHAVARQTKFHPIGRRALDGGNADGAYTTAPLADYMAHANRERFVIAQIEDPEALEELDAIAATPGIDMLFFGPGDFTQGIGHPGAFDHPDVDRARRAVAEAAAKHQKLAGTVGTVATLKELNAMGYRWVNLGADVVALVEYFRKIAAAFGASGQADSGSVYAK